MQKLIPNKEMSVNCRGCSSELIRITDPVEKPIKIKCRECALWQKIVGKIEFFVEVEKV